MRILAVCLIVIGLSSELFAQLEDSLATDNLIDTIHVSNLENVVFSDVNYKLLYETEKTYNEKILNTVYWALSSLLIIIIAIIGTNVFFNYRFNNRKYLSLKDKIESDHLILKKSTIDRINEKLLAVRKTITDDFEEFKTEIQQAYSDDRAKLSSDFNDRLNSFSANLKEQIDTLKERIDIKSNENRTKIEDLNSTLSKNIIQVSDDLKEYKVEAVKKLSQVEASLQVDVVGVHVDMYIDQEKPVFALIYLTLQIMYLVKIPDNWRLERALNQTIKQLEAVEVVDGFVLESLPEFLLDVPDKYAVQISKIKELLNMKRRKKE